MKKLAVYISSAVLVVLVSVFYLTNNNSVDNVPKKELAKVEVEKQVVQAPEVTVSEQVVEAPKEVKQEVARMSVEPTVEVEQRLSSDVIVQKFKERALTATNPQNTGYGNIVSVYLSGHQHGLSMCFDKAFDTYSSKFTASSIESTLGSLDSFLLDESRAREFNQLCLAPQNYL